MGLSLMALWYSVEHSLSVKPKSRQKCTVKYMMCSVREGFYVTCTLTAYRHAHTHTHTCMHECTHMHSVQIPVLSCYSTIVVVKNMLNTQVQADQTVHVGHGSFVYITVNSRFCHILVRFCGYACDRTWCVCDCYETSYPVWQCARISGHSSYLFYE